MDLGGQKMWVPDVVAAFVRVDEFFECKMINCRLQIIFYARLQMSVLMQNLLRESKYSDNIIYRVKSLLNLINIYH
ncbi:hypothetical protein BpHYR1_039299 [Brachionus plicatilis]|uniref:Uncharacterized protein n=1 Tax=Brachionus plicatilis TaxID=10195 RepID=A0A3M7QE61_BRAPC|nr:hypothetical protein BpHYR1_039299 [Brachionus plicatilis]